MLKRTRGATSLSQAPAPDKSGGGSKRIKSAPNGKFSAADILGVAWNKSDCAPQLSLSRDALTVTGEKGYRMVRANACVQEGHYYFEVEILPPVAAGPSSSSSSSPPDAGGAHVRLGWAAGTGNLQGPVG